VISIGTKYIAGNNKETIYNIMIKSAILSYMIRVSPCPCRVAPLLLIFMLAACANYKQQKEWDDIDYSKVRGRGAYENDNNYVIPSVLSCIDDDLYNCN
jgi:hypothetical protein